MKWGSRQVLTHEQLCLEGVTLLAERVRDPIQKKRITQTVMSVCKISIDLGLCAHYKQVSDDYLNKQSSPFPHFVQMNSGFQRMMALTIKAIMNNEPVLLIGDTGCGKTTLC